jgi:predicted transcriptional regulator
MVLADERILEYLRANESGSPKKMADSGVVRFSREYINQRCKQLVEEGFLRHLGNGVYVISEQGEKYLDGDIDAQTLEKTNGMEEQNGAES